MGSQRQAIIIDIDNTILNNDRRKLETLRQEFNMTVEPRDLKKDYDLSKHLKGEENKKFQRIFFSEEYLKYDEPLPSAAKVISDLAETYHIIFLTGRHDDRANSDSMRDGTIKSLAKYGFPWEKSEIHFKDKRDTPDASFKTSEIQSLVAERSVAFGVSDTPEDIKLYADFGIFPVAIRTEYFDDQKLAGKASIPPLILDNWSEVKDFVRFMNSGDPDKLLEQLADEYKSFPSNLDNITSFLLLVNTFALGFVLNAFTGKVGALDLLTQLVLFASVSFLLLSITFGIFALLPRSITYPNVGKPTIIIPRKKSEEYLKRSQEVVEMSADETSKVWLRFLAEGYHTINPKIGFIERTFYLRGMAYQKIKWANRSVVSLLCGMGLLIPLTFAGTPSIQILVTPIIVLLGLFLYLWTVFRRERKRQP